MFRLSDDAWVFYKACCIARRLWADVWLFTEHRPLTVDYELTCGFLHNTVPWPSTMSGYVAFYRAPSLDRRLWADVCVAYTLPSLLGAGWTQVWFRAWFQIGTKINWRHCCRLTALNNCSPMPLKPHSEPRTTVGTMEPNMLVNDVTREYATSTFGPSSLTSKPTYLLTLLKDYEKYIQSADTSGVKVYSFSI